MRGFTLEWGGGGKQKLSIKIQMKYTYIIYVCYIDIDIQDIEDIQLCYIHIHMFVLKQNILSKFSNILYKLLMLVMSEN